MSKEWKQFTGDYEKGWYDIILPDGTVHKYCWPNAGYMNACHSGGGKFSKDDNIKFKRSECHPLDDEGYWRKT